MTSLDTAAHVIVPEGNEGASKDDDSTRRSSHHHHHIAGSRRTSHRERERERYGVYDLETTVQELERLRDRVRARDLSRDRIRMRDRSRERVDVDDIGNANKYGLSLERDFERDLRDRFIEREAERLQQERQDQRRIRPLFVEDARKNELDPQRPIFVYRRKSGEEERQIDFGRRSDETKRERVILIDDKLKEDELFFRQQARRRPTSEPHYSSPSPPLHSHSPRPRRPRPTSQLVYPSREPPPTVVSSIYSDSGPSAYRDRPGRDDRRSSSDSTSAVLRPVHRRPRSAFSSPNDAGEEYYHRDLESLYRQESGQRRSLWSNRSDDIYGKYERPEVVYLDEDYSAHRRAARSSAPSFSSRDHILVEMPPPPVPLSVQEPPPIASPPKRATSPAKTAPLSGPNTAKPTAADKPTEDIKMREKLLDLISPYSPDLVHQNLVKARTKDSGTWLFSLPEFEKWRGMKIAEDVDVTEGSRNNSIWLSGNIGAGKTMLM
ncbi:hypothetical protein F5Y05DRAFT_415677 [Hypoxylon sp. FL0543]|nr:hypothetical protein F5Y05DRAFT_415677 [Hypoxylon sp. FL0543]